VGVDENLKHPSWIFCDNLVSIRKAKLRNFVGTLSPHKIAELNRA
jgi:mRNA interferase MazF